jgi:hypothetical protein
LANVDEHPRQQLAELVPSFLDNINKRTGIEKPKLLAFDGDPDIWFARAVATQRISDEDALQFYTGELAKRWKTIEALTIGGFTVRLMDFKKSRAGWPQQKGVDNAIALALNDAYWRCLRNPKEKIVLVSGRPAAGQVISD